MDLDRFGRPDFADELVGAIATLLDDDELPRLIPFYKCFRAIIRGVVETLRSRQKEIADAQRESALALARQYFSLAQSYARDGARQSSSYAASRALANRPSRAHCIIDSVSLSSALT